MINLFSIVWSDLIHHGGKNLFKGVLIYLFDPRFRLLLNYRIGNYLVHHQGKIYQILAKWYKYKQTTKRNCQISYFAIIGKNIKFLHPLGIVIGDNVEIGDDVRIWQQVTLGSHGKNSQVMDYPVVCNGVKIFAGAKIIGKVTIGRNAVIAANAVVSKSVIENDTVGGIPSKSLKSNKSE